MPLGPKALGEVVDLLGTTLDFDDLEQYVLASLGDRLYVEYVGQQDPLKTTLFKLLSALEQRGTTPVFLRYVYQNRPGRTDVRQVIEQLCPEVARAPDNKIDIAVQIAGAAQRDSPEIAIFPGLQRNVRPYLAKLEIQVWAIRLMQVEHQVCRIEFAGDPLGTGFLVGPDAVLTNWHVVEATHRAGTLDKLGCRFDYVRQPDGSVQSGQLVKLHSDGCLSWSAYGEAEVTRNPESPLPTEDQLDYALLRIADAVGTQSIDGTNRGWVVLPSSPPPTTENSPLLIVQHPDGTPMKLALDTQAIIGHNQNGTRLRYRTNTDPGSSGSPCFTMDWEAVALHHYGDPKWADPLFNQGVPIDLVRKRVVATGFGKFLGQ
jgi:hypothetical protein